jgi:hypothetical protein
MENLKIANIIKEESSCYTCKGIVKSEYNSQGKLLKVTCEKCGVKYDRETFRENKY